MGVVALTPARHGEMLVLLDLADGHGCDRLPMVLASAGGLERRVPEWTVDSVIRESTPSRRRHLS